MGVAGQLQVDAVAGGVVGLDRLVGQQHHRPRGIAVRQRLVEVGTVAEQDPPVDVVHAGQVEPAGQLHPLVAQRPHAQRSGTSSIHSS